MKHIVSVSLGSSTRDHRVQMELLGEEYVIERIGMDGDMKKLHETIQRLDGKVDAIGLGGITGLFPVGDKTYVLRSARPLLKATRHTPLVDGTGWKRVLERQVILDLDREGVVPVRGKKVLLTVAFDRYSMAQAFAELDCELSCGDLVFSFGLPVLIRGFHNLHRVVRTLAPVVCLMPFAWLYPTGKREEQVEDPRKFARFYQEADIIAGDYLYIQRFMPDDLGGKIIITNTVTQQNVADLKARGVKTLVTTTPNLGGRSFGSNLIQAVTVAYLGKNPETITDEEYVQVTRELGFKPRIEHLN
ncbi:MAG TPA: quinate 5-dehydrogenase [Firmicutes bacterium]|uniref:Quinate 5-dehydrogenase n=1 Tax=Capillibacterium thermochitinicola TaxID=2699427 RepID=A0A8J6HZI0_9FIRM|nr:quinate 5-dehydrogenase [Capillibacterium thermochitinicola]MBA2132780.1 quinate 5-dehydrogenase [Capillibacterium thermochitinicola]HHW12979.1 quinate 5-dehydrogenase [Bacillota bacterium]